MLKRVIAIGMIIAFLVLIANLLVFKIQPELSAAVYIVVVVFFAFSQKTIQSDMSIQPKQRRENDSDG